MSLAVKCTPEVGVRPGSAAECTVRVHADGGEVLHLAQVDVGGQFSLDIHNSAVHECCEPLQLLGCANLIYPVDGFDPCGVGIIADTADTIHKVVCIALSYAIVAVDVLALGLSVAGQVVGQIDHLVRIVQHGGFVFAECLEPDGIVGLRVVQQVANLSAGELVGVVFRLIEVGCHLSGFCTLLAIRSQQDGLAVHPTKDSRPRHRRKRFRSR